LLRRQWFLMGLVLVLGAAVSRPDIGKRGGPLAPEHWQGWLVVGIFFIAGLELRTSALAGALYDLRLHAFVQGVSLLAAPLLFFAVAKTLAPLGLPTPLIEGFVVLGCLPTTVTSGVAFTRVSGGDEAGALFNATLGNLLGIVVTPFSILLMTGRHASVPATDVATQLAWQVAAPIAVGQLLQLVRQRSVPGRRWFGPISILLLLSLIYLVFCDSLSRGLETSAGQVVGAVAVTALLHGLLVAFALRLSALRSWRFSPAKRTAAVISSTQKTAALGLPLLAILYRNEPGVGLIALPLLVYHPLQLIVAGAAADAWRRYNGVQSALNPTAHENPAR
jgi:sodium/bile acid cotransporter 7